MTSDQNIKSAQHTPGPWEIREVAHEATPLNERRVYRVEIVSPQHYMGRRTPLSRYICQIVDYCEWTDHPANARLIAAAPDLLAALKAIRSNRESQERGDSCHCVSCSACGSEIGWPLLSSDTPICEDCIIESALAKAEGPIPSPVAGAK